MTRIHGAFLPLLILPLLGLGTASTVQPVVEELEFERADLILEFNATDGDAEIVLDLKSDEDLARLELRTPEGLSQEVERKVLDVRSRSSLDLGVSQLLVETGEPSMSVVLAAYPEGTYELSGVTMDGTRFRNTIELDHELPAAPVILYPEDGDESVPISGLEVLWLPDPDAASWLVELEREDDLPGKIVATLPAGTFSFIVPDGFLVAGTEYQIGVRAIGDTKNVTVSENTFFTE
jgi:hypothetical protein